MITLDEIAGIMGVSKATVSLALNYKSGVSRKRADEIRDVAATLGYALPRARVLEALKTRIISFVRISKHESDYTNFNSSFLSGYIDGISEGLSKSNYRLEISMYTNKTADEVLSSMKSKGSAGYLILGSELNKQDAMHFASYNAPMVILDAHHPDVPLDFVSMNNEGSMFKVVQFLSCIGHSRLGYIHSRLETTNFRARRLGFYRAVKMYGSEYHHADDYVTVDLSVDSAYAEVARKISDGWEVPTALVCDNDTIAIGVVKALRDNGYAVPGDISVIGFDNLPGSEICTPPLTTMTISPRQMGYRSAVRLLQQLDGDNRYFEKVMIDGHVIQRSSVKSLS